MSDDKTTYHPFPIPCRGIYATRGNIEVHRDTSDQGFKNINYVKTDMLISFKMVRTPSTYLTYIFFLLQMRMFK